MVRHTRTRSTAESAHTARSHQKRKEIRRRLHHKHSSKIPFHVKWTQFMHTDTKNRAYYCASLDGQYWPVLKTLWRWWVNSLVLFSFCTYYLYQNSRRHWILFLVSCNKIFWLDFSFFAFAGVGVANLGKPADGSVSIIMLMFIAMSFGFSLMVNAWIFYRISGGLFNPAVGCALFYSKIWGLKLLCRLHWQSYCWKQLPRFGEFCFSLLKLQPLASHRI